MKTKKKIKYNSRDKKIKNKYHPLFKYEHEYLTYNKKEKLINIAIENLNIFNRLNAKINNIKSNFIKNT